MVSSSSDHSLQKQGKRSVREKSNTLIQSSTPKLGRSSSVLCRQLLYSRSFSGGERRKEREREGGKEGWRDGREKKVSLIIWSEDGFGHLPDIQKSLEYTLNLICIVLDLLEASVRNESYNAANKTEISVN